MLRILFLVIFAYLAYKFLKSIFRGVFIVSSSIRNANERMQNMEYNEQSGRFEKDISSKARIIEEDKKD